MKVLVHARTGSVWEEVEVEVNEVNPRIALPLACHEATFAMAKKCDVKPATMLDRLMRRFGDTLAAIRADVAKATEEEKEDATE